MKKSIKQKILLGLQVIFFFVIPAVFIFTEYSHDEISWLYKIGWGTIILAAVVFFLGKKFWFDRGLEKRRAKLGMLEVEAVKATDQEQIKALKAEYLKLSYFDLALKMIAPVLLILFLLITFHALEEQVIKLFGVFRFCLISFAIGIALGFIEIRLTRFPHEVKKNEKD